MLLHLFYNKLPHPYADEPGAAYEVWAEMALQVLDDSSLLVCEVFRLQWDITVLIEWFVINRDALLKEGMPAAIEQQASLAGSIYNFYDQIVPDDTNDDLLDMVFEYKVRHGLRFALRGVDLDDIYIGMFKGELTISAVEPREWSYAINMDAFSNDVGNVFKQPA